MRKCLLGDIADIQTGPFGSQLHSRDYAANHGTPIVTVEHLGERKFACQNLPLVKDEDKLRLLKYTMLPGDIIFSRVGSVDRCSYALEENSGWLFSGRCLRIRCNGEVDPTFLYFYLSSVKVKSFIRRIAVGATMPSINTSIMGEIPIELPSLDVQKAIGEFITLLDEKIELNNQINDYLAKLADSYFKEAFNSLETNAQLSDIAQVTMGQSPAGTSYNEEGKGAVFYQGRGDFGWRYPTQRLFTTEPKRMASKNDVLMSVRAPVGDLNIAFEDCCIGRGLAAIHSDYQSYVLYLMRSLKSQLDTYNGEGTVFGSINGKALKAFPIALPTITAIGDFQNFVKPIDDVIRCNEQENRDLEELRDFLLPKLMSGEIDVSKIDITRLNNHLSDC